MAVSSKEIKEKVNSNKWDGTKDEGASAKPEFPHSNS